MAQSYKLIFFSTLYTVLALVLVSLDGTYNITSTFFGNTFTPYGKGISLKDKGFYIHIFLFALLIALPMLMCKEL